MNKPHRKRLPVSVSAAVFIEDEKKRLLLLKQAAEWKGNKWGPPAGGMEAHEDPLIAAVRETNEEIGVDVELIDLVGVYTVDRGDEASGVAFVFRGKISGGEIKITQGEIADYRFFTPSEIEQLIKEEKLYKPEYNLKGIQDWLDGGSHSLKVIKPLK